MKRKYLIGLTFIAFLTLSFGKDPFYRVKFVYDGDTILLEDGSKVRYLGINAPEINHEDGGKSEFMALASRELNLRLVGKARVRLERDQEEKDRYGRLLAYVFLENGDMVNALLVRKGLANVMITRPNLKYFHSLLGNQREAMGERIGIWEREGGDEEKCYTGSTSSLKFHRPSCPLGQRIVLRNLVEFKDRRSAFWEGFSPCSKCKP